METITYFLPTPRAAGAVTFRVSPDARAEFLIHNETCPYFRVAFKRFVRLDALAHWIAKGYMFKELPA